jgi:hypothetical protein
VLGGAVGRHRRSAHLARRRRDHHDAPEARLDHVGHEAAGQLEGCVEVYRHRRPPAVLDPRAGAYYGDWDRVATESVAILRSAAGRDPYNRDLSDLVGELATQSEAFRTRWAAHNVRFHNTGVKHLNHPVVGELHLSFNRLDLAADHGLTIFTYAAEPGSRSDEALKLLGSWAATLDPAESAPRPPVGG